MSEQEPVFFFSYARKSTDPFLDDFFKKLKWELSNLGIGDEKTVGFRDDDDIDSGDIWTTKISEAVQTCKVLICIYTTPFFLSPYCGKEFAAFLKRHTPLNYVRSPDDDGKTRSSIEKANNIIPVLWTGEDDLKRYRGEKLPPPLLSKIHYTIAASPLLKKEIRDSYKKDGLRLIYIKSSKATRVSFALHFARKIYDAMPLPTPEGSYRFDDLWDAFRGPPPGYPAEDPAPGADATEPAASAPIDMETMVAIEVASASDRPAGWTLHSGGPTLADALTEIADKRRLRFSHLALDPSSDDFEATAWSTIEEATRKLASPILFVDPRCLKVKQNRSALVRLIQREWRGGIILPADESEKDAAEKFRDSLPDLKQSQAEGANIVVRPSSIDDLGIAVDSVVLEISRKIFDVGEVQKPPQTKGPDTAPRISNSLPPKRGGQR